MTTAEAPGVLQDPERVRLRRRFGERSAEFAPWPDWLPTEVLAAIRGRGIDAPWLHQVQAADAAYGGSQVAITTGTASGKTLGYLMPVMAATYGGPAATARRPVGPRAELRDTLLAPKRPHTALYLAPTKALAHDQLRVANGFGLPSWRVAAVDGDAETAERDWARQHAAYVLTNPDFLHHAMLPNHGRWSSFLAGVRYVVIDEAHRYRGVFGSHVAQVVRRLRRLCAAHGSMPTFILASATVTGADRMAAELIGCAADEVSVVDHDASPHGAVEMIMWQPDGHPTDDATELLAGLVNAGLQTVAFIPSRRMAELVAVRAQDLVLTPALSDEPPTTLSDEPTTRVLSLSKDREASPSTESSADEPATRAPKSSEDPDMHPTTGKSDDGPKTRVLSLSKDRTASSSTGPADDNSATTEQSSSKDCDSYRSVERPDDLRHVANRSRPSRIDSYRSGYLAADRRALEAALQDGSLRGLAATNALELGVDVAGLDAVIISGFPGTRSALWQQAGRAGRTGRDAEVILIAANNPLDAYYFDHPELLFDQPVEQTVLHADNPYVLGPHLAAAAQELPLTIKDELWFGPTMIETLPRLEAQGVVRKRPGGWFWPRPERAVDAIDLRGSGGPVIEIVELDSGRVLGTVDQAAADGTVHPGAVYLHQGDSYLVDELDHDACEALVRPAKPGYYTQPRGSHDIEVVEEQRSRPFGSGVLHLGDVDVFSQVTGYLRRDEITGDVWDETPLEMPERRLGTKAVWWTLAPTALDLSAIQLGSAAHAAEHTAIGLLPMFAPCDRWDIGGLSTILHPDTGELTVFVHDGHPGGAGFAERGYRVAEEWWQATLDRLRSCECTAGCPSCVVSPKCGNANQMLDKQAAIWLLEALLID
ncbi:DEAD/DEAH box helicase [Microlunatus elymi]|uniref:DEAD/DEAH box helicase n=1 Tax=Microlunatus elymi TaxID=2596828 RepID=A0A516Q529_9ACTN|nr:DEAD/DEAH box helicase [Microlunatus elymi]QDP98550.1 DEAD/DEAH box helicase [Microlunatus elymi]